MDGGGIYTYFGATRSTRTNQKVYNNIVLNGIGSNDGTANAGIPIVHGIYLYLDGASANIELYNNTCSNNPRGGLFINGGDSAINAHDNTLYNNNGQQLLVVSSLSALPLRNISLKNNIAVSRTATQMVANWEAHNRTTMRMEI